MLILRHLLSRRSITNVSRFNPRNLIFCNNVSSITAAPSSSSQYTQIPSVPQKPYSPFSRCCHFSPDPPSTALVASPELLKSAQPEQDETDDTMNDFLSRFVYIMRGKLTQAYPDCDKPTVDAMLLLIVEKVVEAMEKGNLEQMVVEGSDDFSNDLWGTVVEVSKTVCEDIEKEIRKEKMKKFLQAEEVKVMVRFASEIGIRGDLLRELRFKWAREKMEESEFYESLEELREEAKAAEKEGVGGNEMAEGVAAVSEEKEKERVVSLPKRKGKLKYKIYGLDLSDSKWKDVADKIHDAGELIWPQDAKPITGRCKLVTEKILSLNENDDPSSLLSEWKELLEPGRVDWMHLLNILKQRNARLYSQVAEHILSDPSFQANSRDYSQLIDAHAKENRVEDAERVLIKMTGNGIPADIPTLSTLIHLYSKTGNLVRARESFESLKAIGFKPDVQIYGSMIKVYLSAVHLNNEWLKEAESLLREMDTRDVKPTEEIYMALLRSFSQYGTPSGAQRIATSMQFSGIEPNLEYYTLLIEAFGRAGRREQGYQHDQVHKARVQFDNVTKYGLKPDDRCVAAMVAAYEKENMLDKALHLLLQLEKDGFEPGVLTNSALVDWLGKLQLVDEAEQVLTRIAQQGETPPFKLQVSLCDMYARSGNEKKALQTLGVLEAKKDQLEQKDFERIIQGLTDGGFVQHAKRVSEIMKSLGFSTQKFQVSLDIKEMAYGSSGEPRRGRR